MEIIITEQFTRTERLALIERAIIEMEKFGFGDMKINFKNNQIVGICLNKPYLWGNSSDDWYKKIN